MTASPGFIKATDVATLFTVIFGVLIAGTVLLTVGEATGLPPNVVLADAVLVTPPASMSTCVTR